MVAIGEAEGRRRTRPLFPSRQGRYCPAGSKVGERGHGRGGGGHPGDLGSAACPLLPVPAHARVGEAGECGGYGGCLDGCGEVG